MVSHVELSCDSSEESTDSEPESRQETEVAEEMAIPGGETTAAGEEDRCKMGQVPPSLHSPPSSPGRPGSGADQASAANFHRLLTNRVARLNSIRSAVEIDQKLQEFSSQFCQVYITWCLTVILSSWMENKNTVSCCNVPTYSCRTSPPTLPGRGTRAR